MPTIVEEFHQAWANQVLRAQKAEADLGEAQKRIADLEAQNLKLSAAVENSLKQGEKKRKIKDVSGQA